MKSPENDGFTTEFYNFFWINVKQILIMSFYESYSEQKILLAKHMCSKRRKILILVFGSSDMLVTRVLII
jgi:hypothetical protein